MTFRFELLGTDGAARLGRLHTAHGIVDTPLFMDVINTTPHSRADYEKRTPMGRIAKSEEVAAAATWLCSDAASYVTGAVVPVDGGMTL